MFKSLLEDLIGSAEGIRRRDEGIAFFKVAQAVYALTTTSYVGLNIPLGSNGNRFVQCAYSDTWAHYCVSRGAISSARISTLAPATSGMLDWSKLSGAPETRKLLAYAGKPEVSRQILSMPLRSHAGETALFFVSVDMPTEQWQRHKSTLQREFPILANYFHQHMLRIYGHRTPDELAVSVRELDCLKWIAAGKTAWEASVILGITERTVRFHLNAARQKLHCVTTTQAVAKAVSQNLIEMPLAS